MTRDELIEFLQSVPENLPVYVKGYEMGIGELKREWCGVVNVDIDCWVDSDGDEPPYGLKDAISDDDASERGILISRDVFWRIQE